MGERVDVGVFITPGIVVAGCPGLSGMIRPLKVERFMDDSEEVSAPDIFKEF